MNAALVSFKKGVEVSRVKLQVFFIISLVAEAYFKYGRKSLTVTSISDGKHKEGSKHYVGQAVDFRIWGIGPIVLRALVKYLQELLGEDYDVVLEKTHIHIEYDPEVLSS